MAYALCIITGIVVGVIADELLANKAVAFFREEVEAIHKRFDAVLVALNAVRDALKGK